MNLNSSKIQVKYFTWIRVIELDGRGCAWLSSMKNAVAETRINPAYRTKCTECEKEPNRPLLPVFLPVVFIVCLFWRSIFCLYGKICFLNYRWDNYYLSKNTIKYYIFDEYVKYTSLYRTLVFILKSWKFESSKIVKMRKYILNTYAPSWLVVKWDKCGEK